MLEDGYVEWLDERNFIRYLIFKIHIANLEHEPNPEQPDTIFYAPESLTLITKFVDYAVALYNYFHENDKLTLEHVWTEMQEIWHQDIQVMRQKEELSNEIS